MNKSKKERVNISLECLSCKMNLAPQKIKPSFRYYTSKNKTTIKKRLSLKKYCPFCNKKVVFQEIK